MITIAASFATAQTAAADTSVCNYIGSPFNSVAVHITDTGFNDPQGVVVNGSKIQHFQDGIASDCGPATTSNTDLVVISDVSANSSAGVEGAILYGTGPFQPGSVNEPGSSEEIEIYVDLNGGPDKLTVATGFSPATMRMGRSGANRTVNLNAFEIDGVDPDLTLLQVDELSVIASSPADIRATGGRGTGARPLDMPLELFGGSGADFLAGGRRADLLLGAGGRDRIFGGAGRDLLLASAGNDRVFGQRGPDRLVGGKGRDRLNGGKRRDICLDKRGTIFISCEL